MTASQHVTTDYLHLLLLLRSSSCLASHKLALHHASHASVTARSFHYLPTARCSEALSKALDDFADRCMVKFLVYAGVCLVLGPGYKRTYMLCCVLAPDHSRGRFWLGGVLRRDGRGWRCR